MQVGKTYGWTLALGLMACSAADETPPPPRRYEGSLPSRPTTRACDFSGHPRGVLPQLAVADALDASPLTHPIAMQPAPDDADEVLVLERAGGFWRGPRPGAGSGGLSAFSAAPAHVAEAYGFATSATHPQHVVVSWRTNGGVVMVSRLTIADGTIDLTSERVILSSSAAARAAVAFDAQGYLLVAFADVDPSRAADATALEGTLSRIDITPLDGTGTYAVPADNPPGSVFGGEPEVGRAYATGLRTANACAVSQASGELWCVDHAPSGSEIHRVSSGQNLGWPDLDGTACLEEGPCPLEAERYPQDFVPRESSCGVVGLAALDGPTSSSFGRAMVYADGCRQRVHMMLLEAPDGHRHRDALVELGADEGRVTGVGSDGAGESYVLTREPARILKLEVPQAAVTFPLNLSDTGCFESVTDLSPRPGVVPYEVNAPLWSDGSEKLRFIELPPDEAIAIREDGGWDLPEGTVMIKTFSYDVNGSGSARPVEIRVMVLRPHGWEFHSYRYDPAIEDAVLLDDAAEENVGDGLVHGFPSRWTCTVCHRESALQVLGVRADQLNRDVVYDDGLAHQLDAMAAIGMFDRDVMASSSPAMARPDHDDDALELRARAYLHSNCSHCHQNGGWVPTELNMDLRYDTPTSATNTCGEPTSYGELGVRIVPGDAAGSRIVERMSTAGIQRMPPVATALVDPTGVQVVSAWIDAMEECP